MSVAATAWMWTYMPKLSDGAMNTFMWLADRWPGDPNDPPGITEPVGVHQKYIAERINMSRKAVCNGITELAEAGLIEVFEHHPSSFYPLSYRLLFPDLEPVYVPDGRRSDDVRTARSYGTAPTKSQRHLRAVKNDDAQLSMLDALPAPPSETAGHDGGSKSYTGHETAGHDGGSKSYTPPDGPADGGSKGYTPVGQRVTSGGSKGYSPIETQQDSREDSTPGDACGVASPATRDERGREVGTTNASAESQRHVGSPASQDNPAGDNEQVVGIGQDTDGGSSTNPWAGFDDTPVTDPAEVKRLKGAITGAYVDWLTGRGEPKPPGKDFGILGKTIGQLLAGGGPKETKGMTDAQLAAARFTPAEVATAIQEWHRDQARHPSGPAYIGRFARQARTAKIDGRKVGQPQRRSTAGLRAAQRRGTQSAIASLRARRAAERRAVAVTTADDDVIDAEIITAEIVDVHR